MSVKAPTVKSNEFDEQCYCSRSRDFDQVELQCYVCGTWFHKECIELNIGHVVRFMINYQFYCKKCGVSGQESFNTKQASFHQLCLTALANLTTDVRNENKSSKFFTKEDVINFIEKNWESMTTAPRRTRSTWHATVSRSMTREDVFISKIENSEPYYGLRELALEKIGPYNENMKLILGPSRLGSTDNRLNSNEAQTQNSSAKRGSKRKVNESSYSNFNSTNGGSNGAGNNRKKGIDDLKRIEKMIPRFYPMDHPYNKDNYRYHLVEPDPHSPMRQKFEETEFWAGKPLPGHLYRLFLEQKVALALHDKALQLKISDDRLSVVGEKGYSMVRATHGVAHGSWYFEVTVKERPNNAALRIGWAQKLANLQATCGFDKFSYSWRSRKGTVFHDSIGKSYSKLNEVDENPGFDVGDVLGFYINLPLGKDNAQLLPETCKNMTLVKFKNHLYYEEKDTFKEAEANLTPLKDSKIAFFKNGKCHGIAYTDIKAGTYYPAISLFKSASASINFGPKFKYPILDKSFSHKPISDLGEEKFIEHTLADLVYHTVNEGTYDN